MCSRLLSGGRVYPRVGGGTWMKALILILVVGLSPRGRGNPDGHQRQRPSGRSIPAWAGEPITNL